MSPNGNRIDASVSKSFFVEMIVKDISLTMAVHDLIDNCIDGALRLRGEERLEGLAIELRVSDAEFSITDNCGGMDLDTATNYAFRFGRPREAPGVRHSIGRFGVGMKRAVFKLGEFFTVLSTSGESSFEVEVDVPSWEEDEQWEFAFKSVEHFKEPVPEEARGTSVRVTSLFAAVAEQFSLVSFLNRLRSSVAGRYDSHLAKGLAIRINGAAVLSAPIQFLAAESRLCPASREVSYDGVLVRQVVGLGEPNPTDAGWYVYCNGRMILRADQSESTGWGEADIARIPKYHNYFARFRGCVYFDSDDPGLLPWNTTKDGVDHESGVYRSVRSDMVTLMRPVIAFLRDLANERDEPEGFRPLQDLVSSAISVSVAELPRRNVFEYDKEPPRPRGPRTVRIQYDRPLALVRRVQQSIGAASARTAGESTFDYYVEMELEE